MVGDVAGQGIGAAPEMIGPRRLARVAATDGSGPASMLDPLRDLAGDTMASVLVVVVDPVRRTLSWVNAGLRWPLRRMVHPWSSSLEPPRS